MAVTIDVEKSVIGKRIAREFRQGQLIHIGKGLPACGLNYINEDLNLTFISESGAIGSVDLNMGVIKTKNGGCYIDMSASYGLIRGGHVDIAVMGALEADQEGSFASWIVPGKTISGMSGAMEIAVGAKKIIVVLYHTDGEKSNIKKVCNLPVTAKNAVDMIITQMGVFEILNNRMYLTEINSQITIDNIKEATEAEFIVSDKLQFMDI